MRKVSRNPVGAGRRQRGAAVVEFAFAAVIFFTLLTTIMEFGYMFWTNLSMQHAVREGARYAITGRTDLDPAATKTRYGAVIQRIKDSSMGVYGKVNPQVRVMVVQNDGSYLELSGATFGNPGQIVVISLDCTHSVLMPFVRPFFTDGDYSFTVRATMRNEMFPQS